MTSCVCVGACVSYVRTPAGEGRRSLCGFSPTDGAERPGTGPACREPVGKRPLSAGQRQWRPGTGLGVRSQPGQEGAAPRELTGDSGREDVFSRRLRDAHRVSAPCQVPLCSAPGTRGEIAQLWPWRLALRWREAAAEHVGMGGVRWGDAERVVREGCIASARGPEGAAGLPWLNREECSRKGQGAG